MTLVVGRVISGQTFIVADTALTASNGKALNSFVDGCLKSYILDDGRIAIAFADGSEGFRQACTALLQMRRVADIVAYATDAQRAAGWAVELMVAEAGCDTLWTIKAGEAVESTAGYLGSSAAFDAFQRFHAGDARRAPPGNEQPVGTIRFSVMPVPAPDEGAEAYSQIFNAFKVVVDDPALPEVGGAIVSLCTKSGRFVYMPYSEVFSPHKLPPPGVEQQVSFGTAEEGGYAVEACVDATHRELGVYFLHGRFGLVYTPDETGFRSPLVIRAATPNGFVMGARAKVGVDLLVGLRAQGATSARPARPSPDRPSELDDPWTKVIVGRFAEALGAKSGVKLAFPDRRTFVDVVVRTAWEVLQGRHGEHGVNVDVLSQLQLGGVLNRDLTPTDPGLKGIEEAAALLGEGKRPW